MQKPTGLDCCFAEYLLNLQDDIIHSFVTDHRIKAAGVKTSCNIELTKRILNRKVNGFKWVKYSILRITGPDEAAITQCNKLIERVYPPYKYRKEYYRRAPVVLYTGDVGLDNTPLYFPRQRTGRTAPVCGEMRVESPYEIGRSRNVGKTPWKGTTLEEAGVYYPPVHGNENLFRFYNLGQINSKPINYNKGAFDPQLISPFDKRGISPTVISDYQAAGVSKHLKNVAFGKIGHIPPTAMDDGQDPAGGAQMMYDGGPEYFQPEGTQMMYDGSQPMMDNVAYFSQSPHSPYNDMSQDQQNHSDSNRSASSANVAEESKHDSYAQLPQSDYVEATGRTSDTYLGTEPSRVPSNRSKQYLINENESIARSQRESSRSKFNDPNQMTSRSDRVSNYSERITVSLHATSPSPSTILPMADSRAISSEHFRAASVIDQESENENDNRKKAAASSTRTRSSDQKNRSERNANEHAHPATITSPMESTGDVMVVSDQLATSRSERDASSQRGIPADPKVALSSERSERNVIGERVPSENTRGPHSQLMSMPSDPRIVSEPSLRAASRGMPTDSMLASEQSRKMMKSVEFDKNSELNPNRLAKFQSTTERDQFKGASTTSQPKPGYDDRSCVQNFSVDKKNGSLIGFDGYRAVYSTDPQHPQKVYHPQPQNIPVPVPYQSPSQNVQVYSDYNRQHVLGSKQEKVIKSNERVQVYTPDGMSQNVSRKLYPESEKNPTQIPNVYYGDMIIKDKLPLGHNDPVIIMVDGQDIIMTGNTAMSMTGNEHGKFVMNLCTEDYNISIAGDRERLHCLKGGTKNQNHSMISSVRESLQSNFQPTLNHVQVIV